MTRPSSYPARDPNLHDNWRGRVRADQVTVEVDKVVEPDESYNPDDEEPQEITFNSFALENAVRKNMSIWRSHGMTGERRKYSTTDDDDDDDLVDDGYEDISQADSMPVSAEDAVKAEADDDEWYCEDPAPRATSDCSGCQTSGDTEQPSAVVEENWDDDVLDINTEISPFDLDDASWYSTRAKHRVIPLDFHNNAFYFLPSTLHASSLGRPPNFPDTAAGTFDPSQFDDAAL